MRFWSVIAHGRRPGRQRRVRRDDDRECRQPPTGNATRNRRLRVLAENRPALPVTLAARFDRFNVRGPNLNRLRHPQLMSGVSTTRPGPQRVEIVGESKVAEHNFFQSRNAASFYDGPRTGSALQPLPCWRTRQVCTPMACQASGAG